MLVVLLFMACGNNALPSGDYLQDGARQATGEVATTDDASGDTADSGASDTATTDAAAPVIGDASGEVFPSTDGTEQYYRFTLQVEDAQGDLDGGKVFYDLISAGGTSTDSVTIQQSADPEPGSVAGLTDQTLTVVLGPLLANGAYIVDAIVVRDAAGHSSNEAALSFEVTELAR